MSSLSLRQKFAGGFALVLLLLLAVTVIGLRSLDQADHGFTTYREMARDANLGGRLQGDLLEGRKAQKNFLLSGSEADAEDFRGHWSGLAATLAEADERVTHPERAALIAAIREDAPVYGRTCEEVIRLNNDWRSRLRGDIQTELGPRIERDLASLRKTVAEVGDAEMVALAADTRLAFLQARFNNNQFFATHDASFLQKSSARSDETVAGLERLAAKLDAPQYRALIGQVAANLDSYQAIMSEISAEVTRSDKLVVGTLDVLGPEMTANLDALMQSVIDDQDSLTPVMTAQMRRAHGLMIGGGLTALLLGLAASWFLPRSLATRLRLLSEGLANNSHQVSSSSAEVAAASGTVASSSSQQASSLEETSSAMEELAAMTQQNAANTAKAEKGMQLADDVVREAQEAMKSLVTTMDDLVVSGEQTRQIVQTIDEIAFQTNILALNAAVEAARAGAAGAGFAVVAEEVRALAKRSAEAARDTATLIDASQKGMSNGAVTVSRAEEAFGKVAASAAEIGGRIREIAEASQQQASGIQQINAAVTEMDRSVQANAASSEETAAAARQLEDQAEDLRGLIAGLEQLVAGGREAAVHALAAPTRPTALLDPPSSAGRTSTARQPVPADVDERTFDSGWTTS